MSRRDLAELLLDHERMSNEIRALHERGCSIEVAREVFARAFHDDREFYDAYVANVAMLLHDRYGLTDYLARNQAAVDILALLFLPDRWKEALRFPESRYLSDPHPNAVDAAIGHESED